MWWMGIAAIIDHMNALPEDLLKLSVEERLQLVDDLWESIRETPEMLLITDDQRAELDLRLEEHRRNPGAAKPWPAVMEKIRSRT